MAKIDWEEAELIYTGYVEVSHADLAAYYGVAKSTITRHAIQHEWQSKRQDMVRKRLQRARMTNLDMLASVDERHIDAVRLTQSVVAKDFTRIAKKQLASESLSKDDVDTLFKQTKILGWAIRMERMLLGLPHKNTVISDPGEIIDYLKALNGPTPEQIRQDTREIDNSLAMIIEHKKRIEEMRNRE